MPIVDTLRSADRDRVGQFHHVGEAPGVEAFLPEPVCLLLLRHVVQKFLGHELHGIERAVSKKKTIGQLLDRRHPGSDVVMLEAFVSVELMADRLDGLGGRNTHRLSDVGLRRRPGACFEYLEALHLEGGKGLRD